MHGAEAEEGGKEKEENGRERKKNNPDLRKGEKGEQGGGGDVALSS